MILNHAKFMQRQLTHNASIQLKFASFREFVNIIFELEAYFIVKILCNEYVQKTDRSLELFKNFFPVALVSSTRFSTDFAISVLRERVQKFYNTLYSIRVAFRS